jgi:hypothetical protein
VRHVLACLFISGYTADVIVQQGAIGRDVHFLQKSFTAGRLDAAVRKVLGGP